MKTAVGLFDNPKLVNQTIAEVESIGLPRNHIHALGEPLDFAVTGIMEIPHIEFELELMRELRRIGTTRAEAEAYVEGVRHGRVLVFATGADDKVYAAAEIMNRRGAVEIEEVQGSEPHLPSLIRQGSVATAEPDVQAGRIRQAGGGACCFVW
jgi:hypothetical protein